MAEERWHDFAKEKPSEDMEGRNFIVSNGHYEKIATWCGYWENEPFMGDRLCDEVVSWKFYFTPEEEKANEATHTEPKPMKCDELKRKYSDITGPYYGYNEVNEAIAELRHHKYKRCLAMARYCMARYNEQAAYYPIETTRKMKFLDKWHKRWRELAEKFKEAK